MVEAPFDLSAYRGRRVLITGGLGFIGSTLALRLTGWRPTTSLEQGVRATVDYYRRHRAHYW